MDSWSARKLDLEVGTNVDGKARVSGLPDRLKKGLFFEASEGDRTGNAFDNPPRRVKHSSPSQFANPFSKRTEAPPPFHRRS